MRFHVLLSTSRLAFAVLGTCALLRAAEPCESPETLGNGPAPLREVFVAPGNDAAAGDGSRTHPFQSITRAVRQARPGDAIRLLPGVHAPGTAIVGIAGTSNAPIRIGGLPEGERPVIRGGNTALHLSRVRHLVIENIEITGAAANGINCDDGGDRTNPDATRFVVFRNLTIRDTGAGKNQDGLKLSGVHDFKVLGCRFLDGSAGGSGIDCVGCHRGLIAGCIFTHAGGNAVQCKGGSSDIEIRANRIEAREGRSINVGGSTGFDYFRPPLTKDAPNIEARNIRVLANHFTGGDAPVAFVGAVDCLVANNTLLHPRRWVARILQETRSRDGFEFLPCGRNRFINNLVVFERARVAFPINIGADTAAPTFEFAHNLWYASDRPDRSRPDLPSAESGGIHGVEPGLKATDTAELRPGSPAIGRGRALPEACLDLHGQRFANPPSIGAVEAKR